MDIIVIKGMRLKALRRFFEIWGSLEGVIQERRGWTIIFVAGTDYAGSIWQYATLMSATLQMRVICIKGKSGVVEEFAVLESGVPCPPSREQMPARQHESWLMANKLVDWGIRGAQQDAIKKILDEFSGTDGGKIIYLDAAGTKTTRLATALFEAWKLPIVWTAENIEQVAAEESGEAI